MGPEEKTALAQQLSTNPLFDYMLDEMEKEATESLVFADTEQQRVEAQWRVRSVRAFRSDCRRYASNNHQKRRGAVA